MSKDIETLINSYEQKGDFTHTKVEELLQVKLPDQYKTFLKEY